MSNKTSNSTDTLDEHLSGGVTNNKSVDLKEYAKTAPLSFAKANYRVLLIGLAINILGYILMIGGAADSLDKFDGAALFSHVRITLAPLLIVIGFIIIIYAIMKKPKQQEGDNA